MCQALSQSVLPWSTPLSRRHDREPILLPRQKPRVDGPQTASPSFTVSRYSWSWVLPENSRLQSPREIGNRALRKGETTIYVGTISWKRREVGRLFQKTPSGLHFELTDQKLSAKLYYHPSYSSCCFHWSSSQPAVPVPLSSSIPPPPPSPPRCYISWRSGGINNLAFWCTVASNALAEQLMHLNMRLANGLLSEVCHIWKVKG